MDPHQPSHRWKHRSNETETPRIFSWMSMVDYNILQQSTYRGNPSITQRSGTEGFWILLWRKEPGPMVGLGLSGTAPQPSGSCWGFQGGDVDVFFICSISNQNGDAMGFSWILWLCSMELFGIGTDFKRQVSVSDFSSLWTKFWGTKCG